MGSSPTLNVECIMLLYPKLQLIPHPDAPLFNGEDALLILRQALQEAASGRFSTSNESLRQLFRQAGFVNLWFFGKIIAGYSGPFSEWTSHLHMDMANFRQSLLEPGCRGAMYIPRSHFKDLDVNEPILTYNRGWQKHGELKVGDYVFSPYGKPVRVVGVSERFFKPCLKLTFSDGSQIISGKEHLWRRVNHKRLRPYFGKKKDSHKYKIGFVSYREEEIVEAKDLKIKDDIGVMLNPIFYPEVKLPIHPYVLGAWLGDGTSDSLSMTCSKQDIEIMEMFDQFGYPYRSRKDPITYAFGNGRKKGNLASIFRSLNLFRNKHIPEIYFSSSIDQRFLLLSGLMDTDGTSQNGTATFCNKSKRLAEDVYRLAASLNLRPRIRRHKSIVNNEDYFFYQVSFQHFTDRQCFYLERKRIKAKKPSLHRDYRGIWKIEETSPIETSCIMVEGGMYVVGKSFIPTHNTSVVTEAGGAWEILRNPEIRVRITHAIADTAQGFMHTIKAIFDSNEIVRWLYPEYVPKSQKGERWNDTELVLPNRRKKLREANIEYGGVGGASEGHHFDLHIIDDMIGLNALNAARQSNAEMIRGVNWFWSSEKSLLQSMKTSRVIVVGTRYSVDDVYSQIIDRAYEFVGYPMDGVEPNPKGQWKVYYRKGIEDGEVIFPENFTIEAYNQLAEDDWWSYVTQFMNDPQQTGLAELSEYSLNKCWLRWEEDKKMWFILWKDRNEDDIIGLVEEPITNFDVIQAVDPAATEKYISAKTSRSAVGVLATHWSGKKFLISLNADYVSPLTMFDWMFANKRKFGPWLRGTFLEANAGFKVLHPILNKEESERNSYLNLRSYPAVGDKTARIRSDLQPEFKKSNLYVCEEVFSLVEEERKAFPQSMKKDILDMLSSAVRNSIQPLSPKDMIRRERLEEAWRNRRTSNVTGY